MTSRGSKSAGRTERVGFSTTPERWAAAEAAAEAEGVSRSLWVDRLVEAGLKRVPTEGLRPLEDVTCSSCSWAGMADESWTPEGPRCPGCGTPVEGRPVESEILAVESVESVACEGERG